MAAVRLQQLDVYLNASGLAFAGPDATYQYRHLYYTVEHYPRTLVSDPWTGFPTGQTAGQFGTLHDILLATIVHAIHGPDPTQLETYRIAVVAPPVAGALTALPVYTLARRCTGRPSGLAAVGALALLPGVFLQRTLVGDIDHTAVNVLWLTTTIAVVAWAADSPRWPRAGHALAGGLLAGYVLAWPPGIVFVPVVTAGLLATRGGWRTPAVTTAVLAVVVATSPGLPGVTFPLAVTPASVGVAALSTAAAIAIPRLATSAVARIGWRETIITGGVGVLTAGAAAALFAPGLVGHAVNLESTITEARPLWATGMPLALLATWYGPILPAALLGALAAAWHATRHPSRRPVVAVAGAWLAATAGLSVLQLRFHAYLAPAVAVAAGSLVGWLAHQDYYPSVDGLRELDNRQVYLGLALAVSLVTPLVAGPAGTGPPVVTAAHGAEPDVGPAWRATLDWLRTTTPPEGHAGGHTTAYPYQQSLHTRDVDYPPGTYGVLSWWDYGHAITVHARRIPVANPMQQHAPGVARVLLAPNSTVACSRLAHLEEPDAKVRYLVVDAWMLDASHGYGAMAATIGRTHALVTGTDAGYQRTAAGNQTFVARLYRSDGASTGDWRLTYTSKGVGRGPVKVFERTGRC